MQAFFQAYSYDIALAQAFAFLVLSAVIAVLPRKDAALPFTRDLWLVALFALLHGAYVVVAPRALPASAGSAAPMVGAAWLLLSYVPLFEFGRRLVRAQCIKAWPAGAWLLRVPVVYSVSAAAILAVTLVSAVPALGLTAGARFFQGAPAAFLTAGGLAWVLRREVRPELMPGLGVPLWISVGGFVVYGMLMPILPVGDDHLASWLPTARHFSSAFGFPVALARTLVVVLIMCGNIAMIYASNANRRAMEVLLQKSEAQLKEAQQLAKLGRWEVDIVKWTLSWSDETFRMFEMDPATVAPTYKVFTEAVHPEDRDRVASTVLRAMKSRVPHDVTYRLLMPDGRIKHLNERGLMHVDAAGNLLRAVGTVQDITEQVTAEQAKLDSDRRLRTLLMTAPVVLYSTDKHGVFTAFEGRKLAKNRTAPDAVVGKSVFDEFADVPGRTALFRRALAGEAFSAEVQVDGSWFQSWHQPIRNAAGELDGLVVVSTEVTEQRKAAQATVENRERLATTLRSIGDAVITTDIEGRVDLVNPVAEALTGWTQDSAKGRPLSEVFHIVNESTGVEVESPVAHVLRNGQTVGLANHTALITRGGGNRPIADSAAPIRTDDGRMLGVVLVFRDQTEERRAESALLESEARYRRIIEHTNEGIFTLDADYRFTFANRRMAEMLGYSPEQLLGRKILDFVAEDEVADGLERQKRRRAGLADRHERRYKRADGTLITVQISSVPVLDEAGSFAGATNLALDITERKQLEQQFLQAQKMEAVGRLAGGVAHDFNNLLTVILGYSTVLQEKLPAADPLRTHVDQMVKAGERSRDLTKSLLAFSRHRTAQMQVLSLSDAVAEMEPMLRRLLGEDIELTTHLRQTRGKVQADPSQIDQVIMNLVVNARDAMPEGGRLAIEVAREELTAAYAEKHLDVRPGAYIRMAVTDSGKGIPKDDLPHLFEPFFTTKPEGTGLGLSTVYGIVRNSGGHIWVYSELERGTTFKVYLPEAAGGEAAVSRPRAAPSVQGTETILLVEDDDSVRDVVSLVLDQSGYHVLAARNAADALAQCSAHRDAIRLLLTDMVMPQGGGRELAERVRNMLPAVQVVFMSGYTQDTAFDAGALPRGAHFLQKPVLPDVLKAMVRQALDG